MRFIHRLPDGGRRSSSRARYYYHTVTVNRPSPSLCLPTDTHLVVEVPVQAQDVGVAEVRLDLNLSPKLVLHVRLLQLILEQNLQSHDVLAAFLTRQVYVSELAAPQRLAYVEVAQLHER